MYEFERIGKIVTDIEKYMKELQEYEITNKDKLNDSKTYHATSMVVFAILNRVIDLGGEIISAEKLGAPNTYQDIMPILTKAGVMNKEKAEAINKLVKKRNILAHFYEDINEKELFKMIQELAVIKYFILLIKKRIQNKL